MVNHLGKLRGKQLTPNQIDWIHAWLAPAHRQCLPWHQASQRCSFDQVESWFELSWDSEQFKDILRSINTWNLNNRKLLVKLIKDSLNSHSSGAGCPRGGQGVTLVILYRGMSLPNRSCLGRSQMIDHPAVGTAHVWPVPAMRLACR